LSLKRVASSQSTNPRPSEGGKQAQTASESSRTTGGPSRARLVAVAAPADSTRVAYGSGAWRVKGAARLARLFGVQLRRALVASEADRALVRARAGRYL